LYSPFFNKRKYKKVIPKLILVKGAPLALAEELNQAIFFDQGGILTKKRGIKHAPLRVSRKRQGSA